MGEIFLGEIQLAKKDGKIRLATGVAGLDNILHGGLQSGHVYLIEGDPGSGKTTLGMQFLLQGMANGEPTLYHSRRIARGT